MKGNLKPIFLQFFLQIWNYEFPHKHLSFLVNYLCCKFLCYNISDLFLQDLHRQKNQFYFLNTHIDKKMRFQPQIHLSSF